MNDMPWKDGQGDHHHLGVETHDHLCGAYCLQAASLTLDKLEESYWHEFNDFQLQLRAHVDERDTILSKVGAGC